MKDEAFTTAVLAVMRSVFDVSYDAPVNMDEWIGNEDEVGVKDYLISIFRTEKKRAFMHGYSSGALNAFESIEKQVPELMYEATDCKIGAERAFISWEKTE